MPPDTRKISFICKLSAMKLLWLCLLFCNICRLCNAAFTYEGEPCTKVMLDPNLDSRLIDEQSATIQIENLDIASKEELFHNIWSGISCLVLFVQKIEQKQSNAFMQRFAMSLVIQYQNDYIPKGLEHDALLLSPGRGHVLVCPGHPPQGVEFKEDLELPLCQRSLKGQPFIVPYTSFPPYTLVSQDPDGGPRGVNPDIQRILASKFGARLNFLSIETVGTFDADTGQWTGHTGCVSTSNIQARN